MLEMVKRPGFTPVSFTDAAIDAAYDWFLAMRKKMGWFADPIKITFENGDKLPDDESFIPYLFVNKEKKDTVMVRVWKSEMQIRANFVVNGEELEEKAPESYSRMIYNGLVAYKERRFLIGN